MRKVKIQNTSLELTCYIMLFDFWLKCWGWTTDWRACAEHQAQFESI